MDLLRRFHPSRVKSPANQLPDKNHGKATLNATLETVPQPRWIAIAPTTALDTQIATAMLVRTEGDIGAKQGALLRGPEIYTDLIMTSTRGAPDPGRAAPSAGTARRLQSLHPSPNNPGRLSAGHGLSPLASTRPKATGTPE